IDVRLSRKESSELGLAPQIGDRVAHEDDTAVGRLDRLVIFAKAPKLGEIAGTRVGPYQILERARHIGTVGRRLLNRRERKRRGDHDCAKNDLFHRVLQFAANYRRLTERAGGTYAARVRTGAGC